ncbi:MAG: glutamate--tRNA ligase [Patescibacteria group bacterium]
MDIRVRIAPSPTGLLHIGTARTALFNWLFARHVGGAFLIRIEDTDKERSTKAFEDDVLNGLAWLGLTPDEAIVRQSERTHIYTARLEQLLAEGRAFWCHHTKEELNSERAQQTERKEALVHVCSHKHEARGKEVGEVIRLVGATASRPLVFPDVIRGDIASDALLLGDMAIAKDVHEPLYNFAVVVDDADMRISHVVRGDDHISNTPKQMLIAEALGVAQPLFAHVPLILGTDRSKMSKRDGATSIMEYKEDFLPEALVNFIGALGYTYDAELLSKEDMAKAFELSRVHASGAVFDQAKLHWMNAQYIRKLTPDTLRDLAHVPEMPDAAFPFVSDRLDRLRDVSSFSFFWEDPQYDATLLSWKGAPLADAQKALGRAHDMLKELAVHDAASVRVVLENIAGEFGGRGPVFWPVRVALSGKEKSPDPADIAGVIGRDATLRRIDHALSLCTV